MMASREHRTKWYILFLSDLNEKSKSVGIFISYQKHKKLKSFKNTFNSLYVYTRVYTSPLLKSSLLKQRFKICRVNEKEHKHHIMKYTGGHSYTSWGKLYTISYNAMLTLMKV